MKTFKAPDYFIKGMQESADIRATMGELLDADFRILSKLNEKTFNEFMEGVPLRNKEECYRLMDVAKRVDNYVWSRFRYDKRNYKDQEELAKLKYDRKLHTIKTEVSTMKEIMGLLNKVKKLASGTGGQVTVKELDND